MQPREVQRQQQELLDSFQQPRQRSNQQPSRTSSQNQIDLTGEEDSPPPPEPESKSLSTTSSRSRLPPEHQNQRQQQQQQQSPAAFPTQLQPSQVERQLPPSASSSSSASTPQTAYLNAKGYNRGGPGPSTVHQHSSQHHPSVKTFVSRNDIASSSSGSSVYHKSRVTVTYGPASSGSQHAPAVAGGNHHSQSLQRSLSGGGGSYQPHSLQQIPTGPRADRNQYHQPHHQPPHQPHPQLQRQKALDIDDTNNDPSSSSSSHDLRHQNQYASSSSTASHQQRQHHQILEGEHDKKFLASSSSTSNDQRRTSLQNFSSNHLPASHLRTTTPTEPPPPLSFDPNRSLWNKSNNTSNDYYEPREPRFKITLNPPPSQAAVSTSTSTSARTSLTEQQTSDREAEEPEVVFMAPVPIVPGDPSARLQKAVAEPIEGYHQFRAPNIGKNGNNNHNQQGGGGGKGGYGKKSTNNKSVGASGGGGRWNTDFHGDEEDEQDRRQSIRGSGDGKVANKMKPGNKPPGPGRLFGKAVEDSNSTLNTAKRGKGSGSYSGSSRLGGMSVIPKNSRFIQQDDPETNEEQATQLVENSLRQSAALQGPAPRIGTTLPVKGSSAGVFSVKGAAAKNGKVTNGNGNAKGKGKGKEKQVEEITVSSDEDEDDSDPIENSEDELASHGGQHQPRAGPSDSNNPTKHQNVVLPNAGAGPSSDSDELGMVIADHLRRGNVSSKISHFEGMSDGNTGRGGGGGGVKKKVANSLGAKGAKKPPAPSRDGEGDGEDGYDNRKREFLIAGSSKKKKTKDGSPNLETVIVLAIKPYMLVNQVIPTNDDKVDFQLKLTPSKTTKAPKVTIVRRKRNQGLEEVASFGLDAVHRVEWMTLPQGRTDALAFTFKTSSQTDQTMEQLCPDWISVPELPTPLNELLVISRGTPLDDHDHDRWKQDPRSAFEQILFCMKQYLPNNENNFAGPVQGKAAALEGCYVEAVKAWEKIPGTRARLENRETPTTSKSSKPRDKNASFQQALSFDQPNRTIPGNSFYGGAAGSSSTTTNNEMVLDQDGDWVHPSTHLRRSARQSAAHQKENSIQHRPPVQDLYPSDYVVLEYPISSPGAGVTVTYGDRKRLNDDEFLNDTLIEFGLRKAMEDVKKADEERPDDQKIAPLTHVFNSFFYKKLSSGKQTKEAMKLQRFAPYALVEKWTKKFDLFEKKYIVIPINEHLHWYLAVIVNPKWIIDNCPKECPLDEGYGRKEVPATRGRASMVLDSSSQPESPAAESSTAPLNRTSKYFNKGNENNKEEEAGTPSEIEDEKEMEHQEEEKVIQAGIRAKIAGTEMGGDEVEVDDVDEDRDVNMPDPSVEGGGDPERYVELSDDDDDRQLVLPDSQQNGQPSAPSASTSTGTSQARKGVPISVPTAPPKGASSPPAPEVPLRRPAAAETMDIDEDESMSAAEIARLLGADPTLSNRCWIFTFDSLGGKHDAVVEKLKKYLDMEAKTKKGLEWTAANEVKGIAVRVPQQPNFCDCGLYILHFVEKFLANPLGMTEYIVAREYPHKAFKGPGEEAKRKREERKLQVRQYEAAMDREDAWNTEEAKNKRRTMRAEVESLMEKYKPIKLAKDAKEAEDKRAKDKKREEREKEKQRLEQARRAEGGDDNGEVESSAMERKNSSRSRTGKEDHSVAETGGSKPKRGKGKGKKDPEVLYLESSDEEDGESTAGSPKKKSPRRPPPPSSPPPAKQPPTVVTSTSSSRPHPPPVPTSADFLPQEVGRSTTSRSLVPDAYGSDSEEMKAAEENLGDLDNSQTSQDPKSHSKTHSHSKPTSTTSSTSTKTDRAQSPQEAQSPPRKKRKKLAQVPPKPRSPTPSSSLESGKNTQDRVVEEDQEAEDQLDSDLEFRAPLTPEFPPANQQQLATDNVSTTLTSSKKRGRKEVANGDDMEEKKKLETLELD
ncbi:hypothetical protein JCM3765_007830 [Sporobolomyces pararoseus]